MLPFKRERRWKDAELHVRRLNLTNATTGAPASYIEDDGSGNLKLFNSAGTGASLNATELAALDGITAGTVAASKAVVVDANKDAAAFRNVTVTNLDAGASGTAGTVDIFPATASKGKTTLSAADNAGNTTTAIATAAQAGARTYTIPDAGASASFVMSEGAKTVNGRLTLGATSYGLGAASGSQGATDVLVARKIGIANNTATSLITVTVPNGLVNCGIFLDIVAHLGTGTDASESTRVATGSVAVARTPGAATVATVSALGAEQIATVAGGGTLTLAYGVSSISGAVGATQTFDIQVTLVVTGTITDHACMVRARLLNSYDTGATMAQAA